MVSTVRADTVWRTRNCRNNVKTRIVILSKFVAVDGKEGRERPLSRLSLAVNTSDAQKD